MRKPATVVQQHAPQGPPRSCGERRRDGPPSLNPIHRKRLEGLEPVYLPFTIPINDAQKLTTLSGAPNGIRMKPVQALVRLAAYVVS
jgi:hypothetical protein